jgi:hypothetical protein
MRYYDKIGFWFDDVEVEPGIFRSKIEERYYVGDIIEMRHRWEQSSQQNDNLKINNRISIISDVYLNQHLSSIKYVTFMGSKWKVNSLDVKYPRVILDLGEVYNGVDEE